jgi:hypothetical protein
MNEPAPPTVPREDLAPRVEVASRIRVRRGVVAGAIRARRGLGIAEGGVPEVPVRRRHRLPQIEVPRLAAQPRK